MLAPFSLRCSAAARLLHASCYIFGTDMVQCTAAASAAGPVWLIRVVHACPGARRAPKARAAAAAVRCALHPSAEPAPARVPQPAAGGPVLGTPAAASPPRRLQLRAHRLCCAWHGAARQCERHALPAAPAHHQVWVRGSAAACTESLQSSASLGGMRDSGPLLILSLKSKTPPALRCARAKVAVSGALGPWMQHDVPCLHLQL